MQSLQPGQPAASLHTLATTIYDSSLYAAYISGPSIIILSSPGSVVQTIHPSSSEPLVALTFHPSTSLLAAISERAVYILAAREEIKGSPRWQVTARFSPAATTDGTPTPDPLRTISLQSTDLLLSTAETLQLFTLTPDNAVGERQFLLALPSPLSHALLSPSGSLIASSAAHDGLVKIWRRASFEAPVFDYAYLRHSGAVTHLSWRRRGDADVLFTIATDRRWRVWRAGAGGMLEPFAEVDMGTGRYAFDVEAGVVEWAAAGMLETGGGERHKAEYLKEVAGREPDVVVVADGEGGMSAWGVESVGCKRRGSDGRTGTVFHVCHAEGVEMGFG